MEDKREILGRQVGETCGIMPPEHRDKWGPMGNESETCVESLLPMPQIQKCAPVVMPLEPVNEYDHATVTLFPFESYIAVLHVAMWVGHRIETKNFIHLKEGDNLTVPHLPHKMNLKSDLHNCFSS